MVAFSFLAGLTIIGSAAQVLAHPGHEDHITPSERAVKRSFLANSRRSLDKCAAQLEARGTLRAAELSRRNFLNDLSRKALGQSNLHSRSRGRDSEGEIGPFWVKGELNRADIVDNEPGVINYMHAQFIDVNTCEPLPDLYWDVWNCNSTGVYSGVQDSSNGNGDDASNLNKTALRGLQKTDENGVATFCSVCPGHYSGRATHVHVVGHLNATEQCNGTITGGSVSHIGQLFFDQDLISEVEATYPYSTSNISITLNSADRVFGLETEESNSDLVFNYVYLNEEAGVEGGLFSWITIGVDPTSSYNTSYAALLTADGGVANSNSGGMGGGDGSAPSGGAPSGMSGAPTSASTST
ncbi:Nn.00g054860.m01.CDS01 [Neocucurbitaria sp. VM-36]